MNIRVFRKKKNKWDPIGLGKQVDGGLQTEGQFKPIRHLLVEIKTVCLPISRGGIKNVRILA